MLPDSTSIMKRVTRTYAINKWSKHPSWKPALRTHFEKRERERENRKVAPLSLIKEWSKVVRNDKVRFVHLFTALE